MQLTKFTHSCVRLDDGDRSLVLDPGGFSEVETALEGAGAVLVTHEHPDHLDVERVRAALDRDSRLRLYGPRSVTDLLGERGEQVVVAEPGTGFEAAGFAVRGFGGQHALIHPAVPVVANIGYLIDDGLYHPGDSFIVPDVAVTTLLLPTQAPWSKVSEVIDFAISVRAPRMHQIHDSLVLPPYVGIVEGALARIAGPHGTVLEHLQPGATVTVSPAQ